MIEFLGGEGSGAAKSAMPLSHAVRAGDFVFVSGQVPTDDSGAVVAGNVETQTRVVMQKVEKALASAGCTLADVVKSNVILADTRDFVGFNGVYQSYFEPGCRPARTTIEAPMMLDIRVEIDVIAYRPKQQK